MKENNEEVEYIHLNAVKAGLVELAEEWPRSSVREYSGALQGDAARHVLPPIDRTLLPSDKRMRI